MNAERFDEICEFGKQLLDTEDLDPVYVAVANSGYNMARKERLVLAYTCLYHLGAANYISRFERGDFWLHLTRAALNHTSPADCWPRGTERRHWRAKNAIVTVNWLEARFRRPEEVIKYWMRKSNNASDILACVQELPSFGPWIAFKVLDLLERVLAREVNNEGCELAMYEEPRRGAALVYYDDQDALIRAEEVRKVVEAMLKDYRLRKFKAPPDYKRSIGIMEIETILCKYKSMVNGYYHVGKDIEEIRHGLEERCWGAAALLKGMPDETPH